MQRIIDITDDIYAELTKTGENEINLDILLALREAVRQGKPLPKYTEELKRRLFMEVDGGTDDKYLRYADVCDRIRNTIDTYINAESEDKE